ncbi:putative mitochondrial protein [Cucumis melo var. makuwa]|uniref:Putative mitochondrial protein n=1 Tax=Cucumis melo var. makuwa TaxID=1194695 RepID=A0A5D3D6Z1_CUCMM|nr:putative mitochondrial protein [Cucumis melo var. makuwa]
MKELGELKHFLGLEMEYSEKGLFFGQQKYVKDLLHGSLIYLTLTRPDISYFVRVKGQDCKLEGFCDADYAGDHDTQRSTTGYLFKLGCGEVSQCSKRQPTVTLSTTKAKYRAAVMATQENMWIKQLMKDLRQEIIIQQFYTVTTYLQSA